MPARSRGSMVRGRDLRQVRRGVALRLPSGRSAGQVIDVYVSGRRNTEAARRFFDRALADHARPVEVVTDKAQALLAAVDDVLPDALPNTDRFANDQVEADHGRLKARLRPMRRLRCDGPPPW